MQPDYSLRRKIPSTASQSEVIFLVCGSFYIEITPVFLNYFLVDLQKNHTFVIASLTSVIFD
jgi:hypothetical protein